MTNIQLDYSPHGRNAGMAEVLNIDQNRDLGRYVVANADINVGKVVYSSDSRREGKYRHDFGNY